MVAAVEQADLHVHHRVAGQDAPLGGLPDAGLDRLDELLGRAAADVVLEDEALAGRGEDLDLAVPVLAAAARLLDVPPSALASLRIVSL